MKAHSASVPAAKPVAPPPDAAAVMAKKLEHVFRYAFITSAGKAPKADTRKRLFVTLLHHEAPTLNRDVAAFWASKSMPAFALHMWFDAIGLQKKKDILLALQVSASTLSRTKSDMTLDPFVTERMLRQSELFVRAAQVFGEGGTTWMTKPHYLLDGKAPVECATNEFGGAKVREILNAIGYGGVV